MTNYTPHPKVQKYFNILEPVFPAWLYDYINTPEMLHQQHISTTCGVIYTELFDTVDFFYSSLDHAVGVALIVWHFTHDKKQTLAGLFHDIATPTFKHCVDVMNGDAATQESTEDRTTAIIANSPAIMELLSRDGLKVSDVDNYHLYPIADNDTPKLSADRLEYSLSNAYFEYKLLTLAQIKSIYTDLGIQHDGTTPELGFKTKKTAREFVKITSKLSVIYRDDRTRFSMRLIADILKNLQTREQITVDDLYRLKESDVIDIIEKSEYATAFRNWRTASTTNLQTMDEAPAAGNYYVHEPHHKVRYIDPLCENARISATDPSSSKFIRDNLAYSMDGYISLPGINL